MVSVIGQVQVKSSALQLHGVNREKMALPRYLLYMWKSYAPEEDLVTNKSMNYKLEIVTRIAR